MVRPVRLPFSVDDDDDGEDGRRFIKCTTAVQPVATCRQLPYLHKPAVVIVTSFSFMTRSPHSHYDVTLIVTSSTTELATITEHKDTLPRLIYKDTSASITTTSNACIDYYSK